MVASSAYSADYISHHFISQDLGNVILTVNSVVLCVYMTGKCNSQRMLQAGITSRLLSCAIVNGLVMLSASAGSKCNGACDDQQDNIGAAMYATQ